LVVCIAGCGHINFDAVPDSSITPGDVVADAPAVRACPWTSNPTLGPLVHHTEISGVNAETDPQLVRGDPLTLYFARDVGGPQFDVFVAHRPALGMPFDPPQPVAELAMTTRAELALQVSSDGHGHYVRGPAIGAGIDIYEVQADGNGVFVDVRAMTELESGGDEFDPFVTADGRSIWFTAGSGTNQEIYTATRASSGAPWFNVVGFAHNTAGPDGGASLTSDGLLIVWSSSPSAAMPSDIYFATRPTIADPWGPAQLLAPGVIAGTMHDLEPGIREDGCELFFSRSAAPSDGNWDIYSVTLQ
jgi:hypothetical protein